jgi:hypothetical protein
VLIEDFAQRFKQVKEQQPTHVNELLDFVQKYYLLGEISIVEYKQLFCELDKRNAEKPDSYFIKPIPFEKKINIPG